MAVITQTLPPTGIRADNFSGKGVTGGGASPTVFDFDHTNNGSIILVPAMVGFDASVSSFSLGAAYGGEGLTSAAPFLIPLGAVAAQCDIFYLLNPPTGDNQVEVTMDYAGTPNQVVIAGSASYLGVGGVGALQQSPPQTSEPVSQTVSSAPGRLIFQVFFSFYTTAIWFPDQYTQTQRIDFGATVSSSISGTVYGGEAPGASSVTFGADMASSVATIGLALELLP